MADRSFLGWPFFDEAHRALAGLERAFDDGTLQRTDEIDEALFDLRIALELHCRGDDPVTGRGLAALVQETERAWLALGEVSYGPTAPEQKSLVFRRSLYIVQDLRAGVWTELQGTGRGLKLFAEVEQRFLQHTMGAAGIHRVMAHHDFHACRAVGQR